MKCQLILKFEEYLSWYNTKRTFVYTLKNLRVIMKYIKI